MSRILRDLRFWSLVGPVMVAGFAPVGVGLGFAWAKLPAAEAVLVTALPAANALCFLIFGRLAAEPRGGGWRRFWYRELEDGGSPGGTLFFLFFFVFFWSIMGVPMSKLAVSKRESLVQQLDEEDARRLQQKRNKDPFPERQGATG